jgi:cyclopropane fatty-acyl-phospholipid synthase-like methyltransferase
MNKWKAYNDLAWIETTLCAHEEIIEASEAVIKSVKEKLKTGGNTLLHFACGAGGNDYTFKREFNVTGVDISPGMLDIAKKRNPEAVYHLGDMRSIDLNETFDAIVIPDSIGYMTTENDLKQLFENAYKHLKPGGVFLVIAHCREEFKENNFVYTGTKDDTRITIFENNCIPESNPSTYEATIIYLIRNKDNQEIVTETHTLGLFSRKTWLELLAEAGFSVHQSRADDFYDNYLMEDGEYKQTIFTNIKT